MPPPRRRFRPWQALALLGYSLDDPAATLQAFHHHYRGSDARTLDAEDLRILHALTGSLRPLSVPVTAKQLESEGS